MKLPWNWRNRIEITQYNEPPENNSLIIFTLAFKKGQTPKGFNREIGSLSVYNVSPYFIGESEIDKYFRKRGLGTQLYIHALNEIGSLTTLYHDISKPAQALWRTLVNQTHNHKIDFFAGTLTVFAGVLNEHKD